MNQNPRNETRGVWDERNKTWIRPSGTIKQGRRPMFQPFKICQDCGKPIISKLSKTEAGTTKFWHWEECPQ